MSASSVMSLVESQAAMSSRPSSSCDKVPTATPSIAGTKRGPVPKRRFQKGAFVKRGESWIGMWRVDVLQPDGTTKREQRSQTFVGLSERAARAAFQPILDTVNEANHATPPVPKTSNTVSRAVAEWREHAAVTLKPSTRRSAESHLRRHILPLLGECPLADLTVKRMQTFATTLVSGKRTAKTVDGSRLPMFPRLFSSTCKNRASYFEQSRPSPNLRRSLIYKKYIKCIRIAVAADFSSPYQSETRTDAGSGLQVRCLFNPKDERIGLRDKVQGDA
jgi:hypothetical protein